MNAESRFSGKASLVTGGGRGLGKAVASALAAEGADVAVLSRTELELEAVAQEIHEHGGRALAITGDVRHPPDAERAVEATLSCFGRIDILINCAGVFNVSSSLETEIEEWQSILDTNLTGTFRFCQAAGRVMSKHGGGKIVNFGSLLSFIAFPGRAAYAASKAGVVQLTRVLGIEWIRQGVNVNAVVPGMIRIETRHPLVERGELTEERITARIPAGRRGEPRDIVGPTLFLASPAADYIVGQTLVVDGGWLANGYV